MANGLTLPRGVRRIQDIDGHIYYVVASEHKDVRMGIYYLDNFDDLNQHLGEPGLFFVRNAAARYENPNDYSSRVIQNGDPTVHEGWAMYCWDDFKEGTTPGWRKVAEQESVDGPWGIDERIIRMLVRRTEFNSYVSQNNERVTNIEVRVQVNENNINAINDQIEDLRGKSHVHNNKATLDEFGERNGALTFKGVIIGGSTYIYDNREDGHLIWKDPTDDEAPGEVVYTAKDIATRFIRTTLAAKNMMLTVVEPDGSLTSFDIIEKKIIPEPESEETTTTQLVAVPHGCVVHNSVGPVNYVDCLDRTGGGHGTEGYSNRGIFCPIEDDGIYTPFELYVYDIVQHDWVLLKKKYGEGSVIEKTGASFTLCYGDDDPELPYKKNHISWIDDDFVWTDDAHPGIVFSWDHTLLVRKFGSVPTSPTDGEVVFVSNRDTGENGLNGFIDVCPYSNEPVYYQLFSITKLGARCTTPDAQGATPRQIEWQDVINIVNNVDSLRSKLFPVGTTIVLPEHPQFGKIECEVAASYPSTLVLVTKDCLEARDFEGLSDWVSGCFGDYTRYQRTKDGKAQEDKDYFYFDGNSYEPLDVTAGDTLPEGLIIYEINPDLPSGIFTDVGLPTSGMPGFSAISTTKRLFHSKTEMGWWLADGTKSEESEDTGVIVAFSIRS